MKIVDFIKPASIEEATNLLQEYGERGFLLSGGTSLNFMPDDWEKVAIYLDIDELKNIEDQGDLFKIGSLATISQLRDYRSDGWVLDVVAKEFWSQQLRNMATIGGSIAKIFPWSDFPIALLALDAKIVVVGGGREISYGAEQFFLQQPIKILKNSYIIKDILVKNIGDNEIFAYHKERRTKVAYSTMTAATFIKMEGKILNDVRISAGAALGMPKRLYKLEDSLRGEELTEKLVKKKVDLAIPNYNWKGRDGNSDEYARHIASVIIRDLLLTPLKRGE